MFFEFDLCTVTFRLRRTKPHYDVQENEEEEDHEDEEEDEDEEQEEEEEEQARRVGGGRRGWMSRKQKQMNCKESSSITLNHAKSR